MLVYFSIEMIINDGNTYASVAILTSPNASKSIDHIRHPLTLNNYDPLPT